MNKYDNYLSLDWGKDKMAIARMHKNRNEPIVFEADTDIKEFIIYLKNIKGTKILTFEETTPAQWLYTELRDHVDKIIVCDPYRNRLLSEGPKTDKIDAIKLVKLLKANLLKEVYRPDDKFICLRKLVSGYENIIKAIVRAKNQRSALFLSKGLNHKKDVKIDLYENDFVLQGLDSLIEHCEKEKERYQKEFIKMRKKFKEIKLLEQLPGIGNIHAVKILARVIDSKRFKNKAHYLSYCGLIKLKKISNGKTLGEKKPRYCRELKMVYSVAIQNCLENKRRSPNNPINDYYNYLIEEKKYTEREARSSARRRLAVLSLGIIKTKTKYEPYRWRKELEKDKTKKSKNFTYKN